MVIAIGAFINAIGILMGAIFGLARQKPISAQTQLSFRNLLGGATIFLGLALVWLNVNGTFLSCAKQIFIVLIAVILGNLMGKILRFQKISNRLGHRAAVVIGNAQKIPPKNSADGFNACVILFCAAPLGIIGAITDGLSGYFFLLAVKALMDGVAMMSFVKMFRWPAAMSAFPVYIFLSAITLACRFSLAPFLNAHGLTNPVNAAAGFVALSIAIAIFGTRKVELANYLPSLVVAPLLAWLTGY